MKNLLPQNLSQSKLRWDRCTLINERPHGNLVWSPHLKTNPHTHNAGIHTHTSTQNKIPKTTTHRFKKESHLHPQAQPFLNVGENLNTTFLRSIIFSHFFSLLFICWWKVCLFVLSIFFFKPYILCCLGCIVRIFGLVWLLRKWGKMKENFSICLMWFWVLVEKENSVQCWALSAFLLTLGCVLVCFSVWLLRNWRKMRENEGNVRKIFGICLMWFWVLLEKENPVQYWALRAFRLTLAEILLFWAFEKI